MTVRVVSGRLFVLLVKFEMHGLIRTKWAGSYDRVGGAGA